MINKARMVHLVGDGQCLGEVDTFKIIRDNDGVVVLATIPIQESGILREIHLSDGRNLLHATQARPFEFQCGDVAHLKLRLKGE